MKEDKTGAVQNQAQRKSLDNSRISSHAHIIAQIAALVTAAHSSSGEQRPQFSKSTSNDI